jgi:hypothetical protein
LLEPKLLKTVILIRFPVHPRNKMSKPAKENPDSSRLKSSDRKN